MKTPPWNGHLTNYSKDLSKLYGSQTLALSFHSGKNIYLFGPFEDLLTHPWIITGNK